MKNTTTTTAAPRLADGRLVSAAATADWKAGKGTYRALKAKYITQAQNEALATQAKGKTTPAQAGTLEITPAQARAEIKRRSAKKGTKARAKYPQAHIMQASGDELAATAGK